MANLTKVTICIPTAFTDPVELAWNNARLAFCTALPKMTPAAAPEEQWSHKHREVCPLRLGLHEGQVTSDIFTAGNIELIREIFLDAGNSLVALRLRLKNLSRVPVHVESISPLFCRRPEEVNLHGAPAGDWEVLCQKSLKNDVPAALRLGCFDVDFRHATSGLTELGDDQDLIKTVLSVEAEPFMLVRPVQHKQTNLLFGFLTQGEHLQQVRLSTDSDRVKLKELTFRADFNRCEVGPDKSLSTHWCAIMQGPDIQDLIDHYVQNQAVSVSKTPDSAPPSVYCSWQFYGPTFSEKDMLENLAHLAKEPLPFDVFLIDDCWSKHWGDWYANEKWPSGMQAAAKAIQAAGYRPGIWTCPYLVASDSENAQKMRDWLLYDTAHNPVEFRMGDAINYVLDPTIAEVRQWLEDLYRRLTEYGFVYHKLDFTRAVFQNPDAVLHDRQKTLLQAYRDGLIAVRRGAGDAAYVSVCGGHYGGALGIIDAQRTGSDTYSIWDKPPVPPRIKQTFMRTWMGRLHHIDPDAMAVRRRSEPWDDTVYGRLALGTLTDDEAELLAMNQYLAGSVVCFSERLKELGAERKRLYRKIIPSVNRPSVPLDLFNPGSPSVLLTVIEPRCPQLESWLTVAFINWTDDAKEMTLEVSGRIHDHLPARRYFAYEIITGTALGLFETGTAIALEQVPAHGCRLIKLIPWDSFDLPTLIATDLHYSGGGVEIESWQVNRNEIKGRLSTRWDGPVNLTVAFPIPNSDTISLHTHEVGDPNCDFVICSQFS